MAGRDSSKWTTVCMRVSAVVLTLIIAVDFALDNLNIVGSEHFDMVSHVLEMLSVIARVALISLAIIWINNKNTKR